MPRLVQSQAVTETGGGPCPVGSSVQTRGVKWLPVLAGEDEIEIGLSSAPIPRMSASTNGTGVRRRDVRVFGLITPSFGSQDSRMLIVRFPRSTAFQRSARSSR